METFHLQRQNRVTSTTPSRRKYSKRHVEILSKHDSGETDVTTLCLQQCRLAMSFSSIPVFIVAVATAHPFSIQKSTETSFRSGNHVQWRFSRWQKSVRRLMRLDVVYQTDHRHPVGTRTYNDNSGQICSSIESLTGCQSRNSNLAVKRGEARSWFCTATDPTEILFDHLTPAGLPVETTARKKKSKVKKI